MAPSKLIKMVQKLLNEAIRILMPIAQSGNWAVVYYLIEPVVWDLLQAKVVREILLAHVPWIFDIDETS